MLPRGSVRLWVNRLREQGRESVFSVMWPIDSHRPENWVEFSQVSARDWLMSLILSSSPSSEGIRLLAILHVSLRSTSCSIDLWNASEASSMAKSSSPVGGSALFSWAL